jgi:DNA helicase-2/ATP-dependent DNA helicase PcrA
VRQVVFGKKESEDLKTCASFQNKKTMPLSEEQKAPINSKLDHQLVLAGPGTGKSFTILGYIVDLIRERKVDPKTILLITFTRAATNELKQKVRKELGQESELPNIFTLHGFSLRQLMKNAKKIKALPEGFSIANDFEERYIIMEDIKNLINAIDIREVKKLFNRLSANWETLNIEKGDWEVSFDNPEFLGAWQEHRAIYGYMLRSELVYQLKKALEQEQNINIDNPIDYLIVDEYQDLNQCDLAIIEHLRSNGTKIFCAGDDDQSIYGFRYAYPEGIRNFLKDVPNSERFKLNECFRCDENILTLAHQVIGQDARRIPKKMKSMSGLKGEVKILRFANQYPEAQKIAQTIRKLVDKKGVLESEIIILLRSDHNGNFSKPIIKQLLAHELNLNQENENLSIFEQESGRYLLSLLKFLVNPQHDLAIRTILELTKGLGKTTFNNIYEQAKVRKIRFHKAVELILAGEITAIPNEKKINETLKAISELRERLKVEEDMDTTLELLKDFIPDCNEEFYSQIKVLTETKKLSSIDDLIEFANELLSPVPETPDENVNGIRIMTMHQAKGLTAKATFIVAAEEEYTPGRGDIDEERRLFYVSITRAKHYLFISFCNNRIYSQAHSGYLNEPTTKRNFTRFLRDLPTVKILDGMQYELE